MKGDPFSDVIPSPIDQEEIKIVSFIAEPYPDGRRVKIKLHLSAIQKSPNAVINIFDQDNLQLASVNIVSIFHPENEITIHIPGDLKLPGEYKATVEVFDVEEEELDQEGKGKLVLNQSLIDSTSTTFTIQ
jgi:hypothetical protein